MKIRKNFIYSLIKFILIFFVIYLLFKTNPNIVCCETYNASIERIDDIRQALFDALYQRTKDVDFINTYGRSKRNPIFLTRHYITVLSRPEFINSFLDQLPLIEILSKSHDPKETLQHIESLFYIYVENAIKNSEKLIKAIFYTIFGPYFIGKTFGDLTTYYTLISHRSEIILHACNMISALYFDATNCLLSDKQAEYCALELLKRVGIKELYKIVSDYYTDSQHNWQNDID